MEFLVVNRRRLSPPNPTSGSERGEAAVFAGYNNFRSTKKKGILRELRFMTFDTDSLPCFVFSFFVFCIFPRSFFAENILIARVHRLLGQRLVAREIQRRDN